MANPEQRVKHVSITPPAAIVDNASYTTAQIDTLGWDYLEVVAYLGATDIAMTALKLQSSDSDGSQFADVDGLDANGDTDAFGNTGALPTAADDNKFVVFQVDLRGKKRYWDLVATAGDGTNGTFLAAWARLSRGEESPSSNTEAGALNVYRA